MTLTELQKLVNYVTDADGETTAVLVTSAVWAEVLASWPVMESGLHPIDEAEPKAQILADLTGAIRSTKAGDRFPVSELWDRVYA